MKTFLKWLRSISRQMFTERDNATLCPLRVFGTAFAILSSLVFFGLSIWNVWQLKTPFDYVAFGGGLSAVWVVVAAAIIGKAKLTEGNQGQ